MAPTLKVILLCVTSMPLMLVEGSGEGAAKNKHKHKHHEAVDPVKDVPVATAQTKAKADPAKDAPKEEQILGKMKTLEAELAKKEEAVKGVVTKGRIEVNGPLPADFAERYSQGVAKATGADPSEVKVVETNPVTAGGQGDIVEVVFEA